MSVIVAVDFKPFMEVFSPQLLISPQAWSFQRLNYFLSRRLNLERHTQQGCGLVPNSVLARTLLQKAICNEYCTLARAEQNPYLQEVMDYFYTELERIKEELKSVA